MVQVGPTTNEQSLKCLKLLLVEEVCLPSIVLLVVETTVMLANGVLVSMGLHVHQEESERLSHSCWSWLGGETMQAVSERHLENKKTNMLCWLLYLAL